MEENARIISDMLLELSDACTPGRTGHNLDKLCEMLLKYYNATSYNKNYHPDWARVPFPASLCISPNGVAAHGIPSAYALKEGDIVTLDLGMMRNGLCADAAITVPVGEISSENKRLLQYAKTSVYEIIKLLKPGVNTRDIAEKYQLYARKNGFTVIRTAAGHRIGEEMHMKPNIYNTVEDDTHTYGELEVGQYYCVEPVITKSKDSLGVILSDGWTRVTMDRKQAAMFEHMVEITEDGAKVLTDHFTDPRI